MEQRAAQPGDGEKNPVDFVSVEAATRRDDVDGFCGGGGATKGLEP
jgi:hypothetical protein